ncbi:MAG: Polyferredoxin [Bacteroidetes bacterium]|nr:Polyferredoxin [Bacteroidota bacterium]
MSTKWRYRNPIRIGFQLLILALLGYVAIRPLFGGGYVADFEKYCPFGGLSSIASKLNIDTMSCTMNEVQVLLGVGLLVGVIVIGKLFCSYLCPIGSITEWLGLLGQKWKIRREMPAKVDRPLRLLKYVLLFLTIYFTMTTSELFCKEYDPYFAVANLFQNSDIVLLYAIAATVLAVAGAIVFRLFWCKYLCPLGALSNIFLNVIPAAVLIVLYVVVNLLGAGIELVWLLAGLVIIGAFTEVVKLRSYALPIPKITRLAGECTDCGICDQKCPQGIQVSRYETVTHTDCNLCMDCVYACPLKNALTISKKKKANIKYLAPVATVVLVALSLGASRYFELTTIQERWGGFDSLSAVRTFQMSGLKNVKCYGSAMSVKQKLATVHGIYGLDAWASSHTVRVYYNPSEINEAGVRSALFTPTKMKVREMKQPLDSLAVMEVGINKLFDLIDFNNLVYALRQDPAVYGFETRYGEPVMTTIFYDPAKTGRAAIRERIEADEITVKKPTGEEKLSLQFSCEDEGVDQGFLDLASYKRRIFRPYDREFNGYEQYRPAQLNVWVFSMPEADAAPLRRYLGSLSSHLSADSGVVRLSTRYLDGPSGLVFFDPLKTDAQKISAALTNPVMTVFRTETKTESFDNPFHLPAEGQIMRGDEVEQEGGDPEEQE